MRVRRNWRGGRRRVSDPIGGASRLLFRLFGSFKSSRHATLDAVFTSTRSRNSPHWRMYKLRTDVTPAAMQRVANLAGLPKPLMRLQRHSHGASRAASRQPRTPQNHRLPGQSVRDRSEGRSAWIAAHPPLYPKYSKRAEPLPYVEFPRG